MFTLETTKDLNFCLGIRPPVAVLCDLTVTYFLFWGTVSPYGLISFIPITFWQSGHGQMFRLVADLSSVWHGILNLDLWFSREITFLAPVAMGVNDKPGHINSCGWKSCNLVPSPEPASNHEDLRLSGSPGSRWWVKTNKWSVGVYNFLRSYFVLWKPTVNAKYNLCTQEA